MVDTFTAADGSQLDFGPPDAEMKLSRASVLTDPAGLKLRFSYDGLGQLTSAVNSFGRGLTLGWSGGRIASVTEQLLLGTPRVVSFAYSSSNDLATVTDTRLNLSLYCYDAAGLMTHYYTPTLRPADNNCASALPAYIRSTYDTLGRVQNQIDGEGHVTDFHLAGARTELVSDPAGLAIRAVQYQNGLGQVTHVLEPRTGAGAITANSAKATKTLYDALGRPVRVTYPEGNAVETAYDLRSNVVMTCVIPKVAGAWPACNIAAGTAHIAAKTAYVEPEGVWTCANAKLCNQPLWSADPATADSVGNKTDFAYNADGTPSFVEAPAPAGGGTRPKTSYAYAAFTAAGDSVSLMTDETQRITGDADAVITRYSYDAANRFALKDVTIDPAGLALKTSYTTDGVGNVTSVDATRTDVTDVTSYAYDAARSVTQTTYPNPGAGSPVTVTGYDADGRVVAEAGKLGSQWLTACTGYTRSAQVAYAAGPSTTATPGDCSFAGNASAARVDNGYDAADRLVRTTVANQTGARATRLDLLADGKVWRVVEAEGSVAERAELTTYHDNGSVQSVSDGNGNMTTYTYDGFDRLVRQNYPNASGVGVSPSDVEAYAYDARGLVTKRSLRGNLDVSPTCTSCIGFVHDPLGRLTAKDVPGSADVSYDYDLLGRPSGVRLSSTSPAAPEILYAWDKASRLTARTAYGRTLGYGYASGNFERSSLTHPGGSVVTYSCQDALGRVVKLKQDPGCSNTTGLIASYAYDDLSRRASVSLGNGVTTSFGYTSAGDLQTYGHTFAADSAKNVSWGLTTSRAGQLTAANLSNDAYLWNGHYNLDRSAGPDGRNQLGGSWGNRTLSHDAAGNLTQDGSRRYGYDAENRLTQAAGVLATVNYSFDVEGQLLTRSSSGVSGTRTFLYDGADIVAEYDEAGNIARRYVHGPGIDEPILAYENGQTIASSQRYLVADPQGSIVARADASGIVQELYSYGPYGEVGGATGSLGERFRYTGQIIDADTGLYHYKARAYAPGLGRFLQTDPIGYEADLNLYAYVGGDPVNLSDPSGECPWCIAGAVIGGGFEAYSQYRSGTLGFNRRSIGRIALNAGLGAIGGGSGGFLGGRLLTNGAKLLPNAIKGRIGEGVTRGGIALRGEKVLYAQTKASKAIPGVTGRGGNSVPDFTVQLRNGQRGFVEAKFGTSGLTPAQAALNRAYPDLLRVSRTSYGDVAKFGSNLGGLFGSLGSSAVGGDVAGQLSKGGKTSK